eukprot:TRINITY_DN11878_c0_g1_i1.p1 TRINITY_DN11878_c0_g1~~TRINITY_DN11878_c0_g1_i1.p1  ORF type:complete len:673 (+),score=130.84 TRINITY_DN11878_c0_g1_i1:54-2072(+)
MDVYIRSLVSKQKRRWQEGGFNLDLSYITPRIIAMGFPSEGREAVYRNPMNQVRNFLDHHHDENYWVYNLCIERRYAPAKFDYRVSVYPFADHNPPPFNMILRFCEDVDAWLNKNEDNVVVIHCKAGKGRTGTLIACYLQYCKIAEDTATALEYYGFQRTQDNQGVTIPSQKRYIEYFQEFISARENNIQFEVTPKVITQIRISNYREDFKKVFVKVNSENGLHETNPANNQLEENDIVLDGISLHICGDTRIEFYLTDPPTQTPKFFLWLHPTFHDTDVIVFDKSEVDVVCKSKSRRYLPDFRITLFLSSSAKGQIWSEAEERDQKPNIKKIMLLRLSQLSGNFLILKGELESLEDEIDDYTKKLIISVSEYLNECSKLHAVTKYTQILVPDKESTSSEFVSTISFILSTLKIYSDLIQGLPKNAQELEDWRWSIRDLNNLVEKQISTEDNDSSTLSAVQETKLELSHHVRSGSSRDLSSLKRSVVDSQLEVMEMEKEFHSIIDNLSKCLQTERVQHIIDRLQDINAEAKDVLSEAKSKFQESKKQNSRRKNSSLLHVHKDKRALGSKLVKSQELTITVMNSDMSINFGNEESQSESDDQEVDSKLKGKSANDISIESVSEPVEVAELTMDNAENSEEKEFLSYFTQVMIPRKKEQSSRLSLGAYRTIPRE